MEWYQRRNRYSGNGAYVVAPGSEHENGAVYTIVNDAPIANIPQWIHDLIIEYPIPDPSQKEILEALSHPLSTISGTGAIEEGIVDSVISHAPEKRVS